MRQIIKILVAGLMLGVLFLAVPSTGVIAQELAEEGIITGRIFLDSNGDGILDPDEAGIPEVNLLAEGQGVQITIQTDQNGDFSVQVPWGTWTIVPGLLEGYEFVGPEAQEVILAQPENLEAYILFGYKTIDTIDENIDDPALPEETEDNAEEELEDPGTKDETEIPEIEDPAEDEIEDDIEEQEDGRINILPESGAIFPRPMIAFVIILVFLLGLGLVLLSALISGRQSK